MASLPDVSKRIRLVLDTDSPSKVFPETLTTIDAFVRQQQEAPEQAIMDQLRDDLEAIYKELVDHTSPAKVETFVTILCAFLPVSRPIYVITHWWDLVLRAALRDPRLSSHTLKQVEEMTLNGLTADSPKATEFRKRVIELYLLDAYDESSGPDVLEHATMSAQERRVQQFWKRNLGDILEKFCMRRPEVFFTAINGFFMSPQWRLRLSILLGIVVRSIDFPVIEFAEHPILDSLLLSLVVDGSSTLFEIEIAALATLLPQFAVLAPEALKRILPFCYAILARVVCWRPRSRTTLGGDNRGSDSSSPTHRSDVEIEDAQTSQLRSDLDWQKLESTFISSTNPPSPLPLFRCLYGLYPCNTLMFLRDPAVYMRNSKLESPFIDDWPDILDEDQIRTRSRVLLRHNILHSTLLMHTAESELAAGDRWTQWDLPRITMMCTMLDVRNASLSSRRIPEELEDPDATSPLAEGFSSIPESSSANDTQRDESGITELRCTSFSSQGRARVSVQDIIATYHALKSGVEIDIVDPSPEWPHLLFPAAATAPSLSPSGEEEGNSTSATKTITSPSDEALPPHVEEAISALQRENLLLRNELNYELWLKRENVKRIGRLYQDRIIVKGAEVERQGLHNKLREYKGQVQRLQDALAKEQKGATATKSQHTDYTNRLQAKLKAEKEEKRSWVEEKSGLKKAYEDAKAMLNAQAKRLADASTRVFELETQIKEYDPKVQRLSDYEYKIEQLTKTQQLWDDDVRRYKKQEFSFEDLRNRYRKKMLLVESYEKANQDLEEIITNLKSRISMLESQALSRRSPEPSPATFRMMEALRDQISKLTAERDALLSNTDELGDQIEDLKMTVSTLRGTVYHMEEPAVSEALPEV